MKVLFWTVGLLLAIASTARADFESGMVKFEQGDFSGSQEDLRPLADAGDPRAQYVMGVIALNGLAGEFRPGEGAKWLTLAAEQDYVEAQVELARLYRTGEGVEQDMTEMVRWYRRAAEQGHVGAQLLVADAYAYGQGVDADLVQAYMWYEVAIRYWGDLAVHARDVIADRMTREQIREAQRRAEEIQTPTFR